MFCKLLDDLEMCRHVKKSSIFKGEETQIRFVFKEVPRRI